MALTGNGFRRMVKTGLAAGAHWSRLDRLVAAQRGLDRAPLVLGYHRVVEDFEHAARHTIPSLLVSTKTLERHLDWIGRRYRFVSLDELAGMRSETGRVGGAGPDGRPVAVVTFDDGYRDVYENALPLLERKGIPFAVYVVTDLIGTDRLYLHDELYLLLRAALSLDPAARRECWEAIAGGIAEGPEVAAALLDRVEASRDPYRATRLMLHGLGAEGLRSAIVLLRSRVTLDEERRRDLLSMDWTMLREMTRRGATVGSHTRSHVLLASAPKAVVQDELVGSRRALERHLGVPVSHLAYPDGSFNAATVRAAAAAGYGTAMTTRRPGSKDFPALAIPRRLLWEHACLNGFGRFSPAILSCQVNGVFDARERWSREH